jgi:hypothetical protein
MDKEITEILRRLEKLEQAVFQNEAPAIRQENGNGGIDFSLNERAFIKRYAHGLNGQEVFTLILAYLAGGKELVPINRSQIVAVWKRCEGKIPVIFSSMFSTRAKENGWVNISEEKRGSYVLDKQWREMFTKHEKGTKANT